jgi:ketosteroid isomerase-like protein
MTQHRSLLVTMMTFAAGVCVGALALQAGLAAAQSGSDRSVLERIAASLRDQNDLRRADPLADEFETWETSSGDPRTSARRVKKAEYTKHIAVEAEIWRAAMPDYRRENTVARIAGDEVIVTTTMVATAKDGTKLTNPMCIIYKVRDGAVVRKETYLDRGNTVGFQKALADARFVSPMRN